MVLYIAAPPPGHKTCTKCGQCERHYKDKNRRDGLQKQCVQCDKAYLATRKDEISAYHKKRYQGIRDERIAQFVEYNRNRYQTDDAFRLSTNCRNRLRSVLKGKLKAAKTLELVGCSSKELLDHLERTISHEVRALRDEGIEIVIDHIIPCAAFDFTIPAHQRVCFHYTNLQYLDKPTNLIKKDKLPPGFDFASWFEARAQSLELDL